MTPQVRALVIAVTVLAALALVVSIWREVHGPPCARCRGRWYRHSNNKHVIHARVCRGCGRWRYDR